MIITGYQGIGKSTLSSKNDKVIDLESTNFWKIDENGNKTRYEDWYVYYCQIAMDLSRQGYTVFVACHPQVREYLEKHRGSEKFYAIFPSLSLKNEWVEKLHQRYILSGTDKDYRAYKHAEINYVADINKLLDECAYNVEWYSNAIQIEDIDYDLSELVTKLSFDLLAEKSSYEER